MFAGQAAAFVISKGKMQTEKQHLFTEVCFAFAAVIAWMHWFCFYVCVPDTS